jgi:filamentous hemagglutinin family protein
MVLLASLGSTSLALPANGVVTNGSAAISSNAASSLTITQTSASATINWQSFNIGTSESVRFVQPSSSSVALNRVLGSDPSQILGNLSANGQVFLVNPNGILFGKGASVNVGGLVASTLGIADTDFLAGRYRFEGSPSTEVRNLGAIQARTGGYIALLGSKVTNDGNLSAPIGGVALAAGSAVTLDFAGDGLLNVAVNQSALNALVRNGGVIQADGGAVWMSASAHDALLSTVVDNTGIVQANTVGYRNGRIYLDGGESGVVSVGGTLQASGTAPGTTGGSIIVSGDKLALNDGALLDATGNAGGGTIAIGGGWQGLDPSIRQATGVYIAQGATLDASATNTGNGGTIVAWSDVHNPLSSTRVYGTLRARGGALSGDGGRIETSGHWLDVAGLKVDAAARKGIGGYWLLDPEDLAVVAAAPALTLAGEVPALSGIFTSGAGTPNVLASDIESRLFSGTSVILQTAPTGTGNGDISVTTSIAATPPGLVSLTMMAHGSITLAPGVSISATANPMDVNLLAGGAITLGSGSSITSNGGDIVLTGASLNNNAGAGVFNTAGGRWLVYTNSPLTDTIGGLNSGNPAIWSQDPGSLPPPSVAPGNWFVYASANPATAITQTLGTMQSTLGTTNLPPITSAPAPLLLAFDPPDWLIQSIEEGVTAFLPPGGTGVPADAAAGFIRPPTPGAARSIPMGGSVMPGASPTAGNAAAPPTSRLRSSGLSGLPKPGNPSVTTASNRPSLEAFLRGAARSLQVGTSSSGATLLAILNGPGKVPGMTVTVAPGEGFRVAIPAQLLQTLKTDGRSPSLQAQVNGGPLPAWVSLDRVTPGLGSSAVPANALPLTVRVLGSNGKFAEIIFQ